MLGGLLGDDEENDVDTLDSLALSDGQGLAAGMVVAAADTDPPIRRAVAG